MQNEIQQSGGTPEKKNRIGKLNIQIMKNEVTKSTGLSSLQHVSTHLQEKKYKLWN